MLNVIMLNVVTLTVIMPSVVAPRRANGKVTVGIHKTSYEFLTINVSAGPPGPNVLKLFTTVNY